MGKKKKMPGLNTSSTADISFMLLIFFLVTTSMDTDRGLIRRLPPPPEKNQEHSTILINERNIMKFSVNASGQVMVGTSANVVSLDDQGLEFIREQAKKFIQGEPHLGASEAPDTHVKNVDLLGNVTCYDEHVISLQTQNATKYKDYFVVQNELVRAYNEIRDDYAQQKFHRPFAALGEAEQNAIKEVYPQKISEAEPHDYTKK